MTERVLNVMEAQKDGIYPGEGGGRYHCGFHRKSTAWTKCGRQSKRGLETHKKKRIQQVLGLKSGTMGVILQEAAGGVSSGYIRKALCQVRLTREEKNYSPHPFDKRFIFTFKVFKDSQHIVMTCFFNLDANRSLGSRSVLPNILCTFWFEYLVIT